jgi:uncharacterized protein (DUF488 family)
VLTRRKIVLALLGGANTPISRKHLYKLAFLLRHEERPNGLGAYYDFLPFRYGAYSFAMERDLEILTGKGWVVDESNCWIVAKDLRDQTLEIIRGLPASVKESIRRLTSVYSRMPTEELLMYVYRKFPRYATRSELSHLLPSTKLEAAPDAEPAVYTVGYQGKTVDKLFDGLIEAGIERLVDVRKNPMSRQYGLARKSMSRIADELGIEYAHRPDLGIPSERRKGLSNFASYQRLLTWYETVFLLSHVAEVEEVSRLVAERPTALLCLESDVRCCHRGRLAAAVARHTELPVRHL